MASTIPHAALIAAFGDDPGVLPDGHVLESGREDWPVVLEALAGSGWPMTSTVDRTPARSVSGLLAAAEGFAVRPAANLQVNFFLGYDDVRFDVDLREVADQAAVDRVCAVMRLLGAATGKSVVVTDEGGSPDRPVVLLDRSGVFTLTPPRY